MKKVLCFVLGFMLTAPAHAQFKDCEDAVAACKQKCGEQKVYDYESQKFLTNTILKEQCESVCASAFKPCTEQDSVNGCDTFLYRCVANCPWQTRERNTMEMSATTDVFYKCGYACGSGHDACHATSQKTPQKRARTGTFYTCIEAQSACYTTCMALVPMDSRGIKIESNFPDVCAEACAAGVNQCDRGGESMCSYYYHYCAEKCPDIDYDEFEEPFSDTENGKNCLKSCDAGADHCASLSK